MALNQKFCQILASTTTKLKFTITDRVAGTAITTGSGTVLVKNNYGTTALAATSLTHEGSGVWTYTIGPTILTTPGLFKVTLSFTSGSSVTITEEYPLLVSRNV